MDRATSICGALLGQRVIPVLRFDSGDQARFAVECLLDAGFGTVEITLTTPGAVELIAEFRARLQAQFLVGAGTVLDHEQARRCLDAGADYLVTPCVVPGVAALAHAAGRAALIGALTPSEVRSAVAEGSDIVKLFPASTVGPAHLAAIRAVFPRVKLCPTGGVNLENMPDYLRAGADLVGVGNSIIDKAALRDRDRVGAAASAKRYLELAQTVR